MSPPGNHEFDYGMDRAKAIMKEADFPYLSCNWVDLRTTLRVLPDVKYFVHRRPTHCLCGHDHPRDLYQVHPGLLYG